MSHSVLSPDTKKGVSLPESSFSSGVGMAELEVLEASPPIASSQLPRHSPAEILPADGQLFSIATQIPDDPPGLSSAISNGKPLKDCASKEASVITSSVPLIIENPLVIRIKYFYGRQIDSKCLHSIAKPTGNDFGPGFLNIKLVFFLNFHSNFFLLSIELDWN